MSDEADDPEVLVNKDGVLSICGGYGAHWLLCHPGDLDSKPITLKSVQHLHPGQYEKVKALVEAGAKEPPDVWERLNDRLKQWSDRT